MKANAAVHHVKTGVCAQLLASEGRLPSVASTLPRPVARVAAQDQPNDEVDDSSLQAVQAGGLMPGSDSGRYISIVVTAAR